MKSPAHQPTTYDPTVRIAPPRPLSHALASTKDGSLTPQGDRATLEHMNRWEHHIATGQIGSRTKMDPKILARHVRNELVLLGRR